MERRPCRDCRRPVDLARTAATGKWMTLDEDVERGNVLIDEFGRAHVFRDHQAAADMLEKTPERWSASTYIAHRASGQCQAHPDRAPRRREPDAQESLL